MKRTKEELKQFFENGDKPTQEQFWDWQDSYWHKEDAEDIIPANRVDLSTKADLVNGKVPVEQLPSFVDDILEFESLELFPTQGEEGKLFLAKNSNKVYRWSGSVYVNITQSETDTLDSVAKRGNLSSVSVSIKDTNATLDYNAVGDSNISFGNMNPAATGTGNASFGKDALKSLTTGTYNLGLGLESLKTLTTGNANTAINLAMTGFAGGNITGKFNVGIGVSAINNLQTGHRNTCINTSGSYITSGTDNICIGYMAGNSLKTGKNNVFIGNGAGATSTSATDYNNKLCIASRVFNNSTGFWDTASPNYSDYKEGLISGDFLVKEVNINGKFSVTASQMINSDATFTKNIVAKPDGTFGWEDKKALEVNVSKNSTFPLNAIAGDLFFNSSDNKHYGFDGTNWNALY